VDASEFIPSVARLGLRETGIMHIEVRLVMWMILFCEGVGSDDLISEKSEERYVMIEVHSERYT
jgi:hypothetical protein